MTFLKFTRDRRGYESTFLLHAARHAQSGHPQLLYWFRSPPHVKIGRAAFDEDAISMLERQHPEVEFDWDRILTTRPPAAPEARDPREGRARGKPDRRASRDPRREPPPGPAAREPARTAEPADVSARDDESMRSAAAVGAPAAEPVILAPMAPVEATVPIATAPPTEVAAGVDSPDPSKPSVPLASKPEVPVRRFVRIFDAPSAPHHATELATVERLLGAEQLTVLRARYAEILARISARGGDPARVEALREQAERVNPDGWVTSADVEAGLATVDATLAELHRIVGRRRRRRHRRAPGEGPTGEAVVPVAEPLDPSPGEGADDDWDAGEEPEDE